MTTPSYEQPGLADQYAATHALTPEDMLTQQGLINGVHAVVGGLGQDHEPARLAYGVRLLSGVEWFVRSAESDVETFYSMVNEQARVRFDRALSAEDDPERQGLMTRLGRMAAAGHLSEAVPAIKKAFVPAPDAMGNTVDVIDDAAASVGLAKHLRFALLAGITMTATANGLRGKSYPVVLDMKESKEPLQGTLIAVDVNPKGEARALVGSTRGERTFALDQIRSIQLQSSEVAVNA